MSHLLVLFGPKRGIRVELGPSLVVGRGGDVGLQLVDPKVSREHCRFTLTSDGTRLEDLGSQNGTFVNGARLTRAQSLAAGDEVAVGDSLMVFDGTWDVTAARYDDVALLWGDERQGATAPAAVDPNAVILPGSADPSPRIPEAHPPATPTQAAFDALIDGVVRLGRELDAAPSEEARARAVLQTLVRTFAPERAFVLVKNPSGIRPLVGQSADACVPLSRALLAQAEAAGRAVVIGDALTDRTLAAARSVAHHKLRSVLVAPLFHRGSVTGFLHCDRVQPTYTSADAHALDAFAAVVSAHALGRAPDPETFPSAPATSSATPKSGDRPRTPAHPAGDSPAFAAARARAEAAAPTPSTILITGETGVGKEEMARFIHAASPRAEGPFVVVNAGAIPDALAESQLFGHERGAFTGAISTQLGLVEQADGGTLFLDEIGELGPALQVKLLRVLQERAVQRLGAKVARRVDCRVLAATHRDLAAEVRAGRFRQDLFYRLNVIEVRLPPLRERAEDLPALVDVLLPRLGRMLGRTTPSLSPEALDLLGAHDWPGNIRELSNVLERALVLRPLGLRTPLAANEIRSALGDAAAPLSSPAPSPSSSPPIPPSAPLPASAAPGLALKIAQLERAEIEAALRAARGVKARAAQELGMSRPTLDKKITELGIDLWREKET